MITDYFRTLDVYMRIKTADDLGGFTISYVKIATIKGLLNQSSSSEQSIANQLGVKCDYILMTCTPSDIVQGTIIADGSRLAMMNSELLQGEEKSDNMSAIYQGTAEKYKWEA